MLNKQKTKKLINLITLYDDCIKTFKKYIQLKHSNLDIHVMSRQGLCCSTKLLRCHRKILTSNFSIIYLEIPNHRKEIIQKLCNELNLEFLEKNYRKLYIKFKIKNLNTFYTLLKLIIS